MVKLNKKTVLAIVLTLIVAILMPIVVITLPKEDSTIVQAATLTDSQLEQRRATPGLYEHGTTTLAKDSSGNEMTWEYMCENGYIYVNKNGHVTDGNYFISHSSAVRNLKGDLVCPNVSNLTSLYYAFYNFNNINVIDVTNLDTSKVTMMENMFGSCSVLEEIIGLSTLDTSKVTTFENMFCDCSLLKRLELTNFVTTSATNFSNMFYRTKQLEYLNISTFDLSNVSGEITQFLYSSEAILKRICVPKQMGSATFKVKTYNATNYYALSDDKSTATRNGVVNSTYQGKMLDLYLTDNDCALYYEEGEPGLYKTGTQEIAIDTSSCFKEAPMTWRNLFNIYNLATISSGTFRINKNNKSNFPTGDFDLKCGKLDGVTSLNSAFSNFNVLVNVDFGETDLSNVTNVSYMFAGCDKLKSVNFGSNKNIENVIFFNSMFANCSSLESVDLSMLDMKNATEINGMFSNCTALKTIKTPKDTNGFTFSEIGLTRKYYKNSTTNEYYNSLAKVVPSNALLVYEKYVPSYNTPSSIEDRINYPGLYETNATTLLVSWDDLISDGIVAFNNGAMKVSYEIEAGDLICGEIPAGKQLTNMQETFRDCINLTGLDVTNLDTSNVTSMRMTFCIGGDSQLTWLNFNGIDTGNVTDMFGMFAQMPLIKEFDVSCLDYSNVTDLQYFFDVNTGLEKVDFGNVELKSITDASQLEGMFEDCDSIKEVKLPKGITELNVTLDILYLYNDTYKSTLSNSILDISADNLTSGDVIYVTDYTPTLTPGGSDTPDTPSTGVATDMMGLIVTAVIVVAICYVATRKKKVQR